MDVNLVLEYRRRGLNDPGTGPGGVSTLISPFPPCPMDGGHGVLSKPRKSLLPHLLTPTKVFFMCGDFSGRFELFFLPLKSSLIPFMYLNTIFLFTELNISDIFSGFILSRFSVAPFFLPPAGAVTSEFSSGVQLRCCVSSKAINR